MFDFVINKLRIKDGIITYSISEDNKIDGVVLEILNEYEKTTYESLIKSKNKHGFKYVLSKLENKAFEKNLNSRSKKLIDKKINVFLYTQHPNFIGDKIISEFSNFTANMNANYIVMFEPPLKKYMMNSSVRVENILNKYTDLLKNFIPKKDIEIDFILIHNSSILNFKQINIGAKNPLYIIRRLNNE